MHHSASGVTVDDLGNEYAEITSNCTHFKTFTGFSAQDVAYERWLEAQAQKRDNGSKSTSKCFKCDAIGHWARDCPASKQDGDAAGRSSSMSEGDYPRVPEATKVKKGSIRKSHTPRVLSKAPPRRQPSIKDCVERMRN